MIATACLIALGAISASALLNLYRLAIGPDVLDRALALDTLVVNAIVDALKPYGVADVPMPATPLRVWKAIQAGGGKRTNIRGDR